MATLHHQHWSSPLNHTHFERKNHYWRCYRYCYYYCYCQVCWYLTQHFLRDQTRWNLFYCPQTELLIFFSNFGNYSFSIKVFWVRISNLDKASFLKFSWHFKTIFPLLFSQKVDLCAFITVSNSKWIRTYVLFNLGWSFTSV